MSGSGLSRGIKRRAPMTPPPIPAQLGPARFWSPAAGFMLLLFIYPPSHWAGAPFNQGGRLARGLQVFFTTDNEWPTIWTTLEVALPRRHQCRLCAPIACRCAQSHLPAVGHHDPGRADHARHRGDRGRHADLFRAQRLAVRFCSFSISTTSHSPHACRGVLISVISGFPFAFLLMSYITGIDPAARAQPRWGGAEIAVPPHFPALLGPPCFCPRSSRRSRCFPAILLGSADRRA